MTRNSIDFMPLPQEAEIPVRKSFRVPVSRKDNILAIIDGKTFSVANVSASGIAVHAESCLEFEAGQLLEQAELWLGTIRLTNLKGRVVHCSVHATGALHFGIQWLEMTAESRDLLSETLEKIKARALKADGESRDGDDHRE